MSSRKPDGSLNVWAAALVQRLLELTRATKAGGRSSVLILRPHHRRQFCLVASLKPAGMLLTTHNINPEGQLVILSVISPPKLPVA